LPTKKPSKDLSKEGINQPFKNTANNDRNKEDEMDVIKTDVIKRGEKIIIGPDSFGLRITISIPVYLEFPKKRLTQCLKQLRQTTLQLKNKQNRESWERIIKTGELLLQGEKPQDISLVLKLKPSTIKCYLLHLDYQMNKNKNMTG